MNWEDLRYILALAREGTILNAARALEVSPTTVSRRLRSLERDQGTALFEKFKHGAVLTDAGHRVVEAAERVDHLMAELDAEIHGLDAKLSGSLRVTSTDNLFLRWLPDLGEFGQQYPDIQLELISSTSLLNMTLREADVALRLGMKAPEHLIGRSFGRCAFAVYGTPELVEATTARVGSKPSYADFPWIAWDLSTSRSTDAWLAEEAPGARVVLRPSGMNVFAEACKIGAGLAFLPCLIGDADPGLCRVGDYFMADGPWVWVLTHPQLRGTARVRAFTKWMRAVLERDRELIEGHRPQPRAADLR